jgi:hypothetical protein
MAAPAINKAFYIQYLIDMSAVDIWNILDGGGGEGEGRGLGNNNAVAQLCSAGRQDRDTELQEISQLMWAMDLHYSLCKY